MKKRLYFLDYLRGFLVALVVVDHTSQGYAEKWSSFWYISDPVRSRFFDVLHMHNNSFMMPLLFLVSGLFVPAGLRKYGLGHFIGARIKRLVPAFIFGILVLVPPQLYFPYKLKHIVEVSYFDYWKDIYFWQEINSSGFWFLSYLFVLNLFSSVLFSLFPKLLDRLGSVCKCFWEKPLIGIVTFFLFSAVIIGPPDILYGASYWIGFAKVFYIQGSRFLLQMAAFFLGIGLAHGGLMKEHSDQWSRLGRLWPQMLIGMILSGSVYIGLALTKWDWVYNWNYSLQLFHHFPIDRLLDYYKKGVAATLLRTTLHALFYTFQIYFYLGFFYKVLNKPSKFGSFVSLHSFGLYVIHEPFIVFGHFILMTNSGIPIGIKFLIICLSSLILSYGILQFMWLPLKAGLNRLIRSTFKQS